MHTHDRFGPLERDTVVEQELCVPAGVDPSPAPTFTPFPTLTPLASRTPSPTPTVTPVSNVASAIQIHLGASVLEAGTSAPVGFTVVDGFGVPVSPQPQVTTLVEADAAAQGTLPTVASASLLADTSARGGYTLHASLEDPPVEATVRFAVLRPGFHHQLFAQLSAFAGTLASAMDKATVAILADDLPAVADAKAAIDAALAAVDFETFAIAAPFVPVGGFPPTTEQVPEAGHLPTSSDGVYRSTVEELDGTYGAVIAILEAIDSVELDPGLVGLLDAQLVSLESDAARLGETDLSVFGAVDLIDENTILLAKKIPVVLRLLAEISNAALGEFIANPPSASASLLDRAKAAVLALVASDVAQALVLSNLLEWAAKVNPVARVANAVYGDVFADLDEAIGVVALELILSSRGNSELCAAVSGESVSVIAPGLSGSFIEGKEFNPIAGQNVVYFVGPEAPEEARNFVDGLDDLLGDIDDLDDLGSVLGFFQSLLGGSGLVKARTTPSSVLIDVGALCTIGEFDGDQLLFDAGFPDVLGDCQICLGPVVILHSSPTTGGTSFIRTNMVRP